MRSKVPFNWSLVWCVCPSSLRVSTILSPFSDSARSLSSASLNLSSTGLLLLSPGVPTDNGEGVAESGFLYSLRATYKGPAASSSLSLLVSSLVAPVRRAPGTSSWRTSFLLLERYVPLQRSCSHRAKPAACSLDPLDRAFSRYPDPRTLEALNLSSSLLALSMSLS